MTKQELLSHLASREIENAKCHTDLAENCEAGSPDHAFHTAMADKCVKSAEVLSAHAKAANANKAAGLADDLDAVVPIPGISRVVPDAPLRRAVLRPGQPDLPEMQPAPVFEKVFGNTETREGS